MSLFQKAAHLNNDGVAALLKGDQSYAIESMAKAIQLMKTEFDQQARSAAGVQHSAVARIEITSTVEIPSTMESSDTIVFNQAIRLPADAHSLSEFDIKIYLSAVIFNLALAHHFKASGNAVCTTKAEKLYCMALKLLDDNALNVHTGLVVKLACINNLSQIRYSRGDYKNAREGVNQVSSFMRRQQSSNQAMFEEPEIQGLLMNMLLLFKAPVVASAA
jgi:sulfur transfer complex TusBCD TusB component (DsrH family)